MHISSHGELNYICPSSNIYGICLFFFPHFFLPEPASESHHITALNQINVTEGSKGGGSILVVQVLWKRDDIKFGVANLFPGLFFPILFSKQIDFFLDFYTGTKEDERD